MFDIDLTKKLFLKEAGKVSHTVDFKVNGTRTICTCRQGLRIIAQKELSTAVAEGMYRKFLDDGYRRHAFVTSIPVE